MFNSLVSVKSESFKFQQGSGQSALTARGSNGLFYCCHHEPMMYSRRSGKTTQLDATSHYYALLVNLKGI
jgi:hypothetical protein